MPITFNATSFGAAYVAEVASNGDGTFTVLHVSPDYNETFFSSGSGSNSFTGGYLNGTVSTVGDRLVATESVLTDHPGGHTGSASSNAPVGGAVVAANKTVLILSGDLVDAMYPPPATGFIAYSTQPLTDGQVLNFQGTSLADYVYVQTSGTNSVPCYRAGTLLLTAKGRVAVETLRIGDSVATLSGALRPIRWIGTRSYHPRFIAGNPDLLPVIVRAGALADGIPSRDLHISPKHALFLDGVLIPAERLINGRSIVQVSSVDTLTYVHVELDSHDVLIAEDAPSESYLDCGNRGMFQTPFDGPAASPGVPGEAWAFCVERVEAGPILHSACGRIAARAGLTAHHAEDAAQPGTPDARIDVATHAELSGWAFDPSRPHTAVELEILVDGHDCGSVIANEARVDLRKAGMGNGWCAFHHRFEPTLSVGLDHRIAVRSAGVVLAERMLAADARRPGPLDGRIDCCNPAVVSGWAVDTDHPNLPVRLEILRDGIPIGLVTADRFRPDLAAAGIANGRCGYGFNLERMAVAGHCIGIRRADTGAMLGTVDLPERRLAKGWSSR